MSCLRILDSNLADTASDFDASSQDADFPVTNLLDFTRRRKSWRSAGHFVVASGSNSIVFRETTGVDLTASVAVGSYTSISTFLAAVKTALDAAGASTYTVSQDTTTKKFKIASDGLGGGGIFELRWGSSTAMAALMGFDTVNLTGALTYTADDLSIHSYEYLLIDFGVPTSPTDFVAVGPRNSFLNLTEDAVVVLEGNETDNWSAPQYTETVPYDASVLVLSRSTGLHTTPLRYWRLKITDPRNPDLYVSLSKVYLGRAFTTARGCAQFPFNTRHVDDSVVSRSEGSQIFVDVREKSQVIALDWFGLTTEDVENLEQIWIAKGLSTPFMAVMDPNEAFSTRLQYWVRMVRFEGAPEQRLVSPGVWGMGWDLLEEV